MPPYKESFQIGTEVQIVPRDILVEFSHTWKYHHPLQMEQLEYAGKSSRVKTVGFYHGGDVIYSLEDIPGIWHEICLRAG
jgi:hypothetical protein